MTHAASDIPGFSGQSYTEGLRTASGMMSISRISDADFATVAELLHGLTGIYLTEAKRAMVVARLGKRVKALGLGDLSDYVRMLAADRIDGEREEMIQALTTNMTRFDREAKQFVHFEEQVMPGLAARAAQGDRVRLWSAGCSSGEEPYSLAFRVLDACADAGARDLRILATDIDRRIVGRALAGRYPRDGLAPLRDDHKTRYFNWPDGPSGTASVVDEARELIAFRVLNLLAEWPFHGSFDAILCRNVTIYFDAETQARLWRRFTERLLPGGVLYIGHSEGLSDEMQPHFESEGAGVFRKIAGGPQNRVTQAAAPHGPPRIEGGNQ